MNSLLSYRLILATLLLGILLTFGCSGGGGSSGGDGADGDGDVQTEDNMPGQGVYINSDSDDPLIILAIDDYDLYYSFYGVRDNDGLLIYYDRLELFLLNDTNELEHYLTIEFDEYGRPILFTLPDLGGEILLDYIFDPLVEVTVNSPDGTSETIFVDNPFPVPDSQGAEVIETINWEEYGSELPAISANSGLEEIWRYVGYIKVCEIGLAPTVDIKRDIPSSHERFAKLVHRIIPKVSKLEGLGDGEPDYEYKYSIKVPNPSYESWKSECIKEGIWNGTVGLGEKIIGIPVTIVKTVGNVFKDYKNGSKDNSKKQLIDTVGDKITKDIPVASTIRQVFEYCDKGADLHNGPCSRKIWQIMRTTHNAKHDIYCTYGSSKKHEKFTPTAPDPYDPGPRYAPDFDFSDKCCNNVTEAGGDAPETHTHELGKTKGTFGFSYQTYTIKDQIQVIYGGSTIFDTGCVGASGTVNLPFAGTAHEVTVKVIPNCEGDTSGTAWNYTVTCPQ